MAGAAVAALGAGVLNGTGYLDGHFTDLAHEAARFDPNGNLGKIRTTLDLKMRGYQMTSNTQASSLTDVTHQGLDLVAYDPHGLTDIVLDSKYSSTDGPPSINNTQGLGRQMSERWLQSPVLKSGVGYKLGLQLACCSSTNNHADETQNSCLFRPTLGRAATESEPKQSNPFGGIGRAGRAGS